MRKMTLAFVGALAVFVSACVPPSPIAPSQTGGGAVFGSPSCVVTADNLCAPNRLDKTGEVD